MDRPDYDSPKSLKKLLDDQGFSMQKKFGQNFLVNGTAREKIISLIGCNQNDKVWEIGPGLGAMTAILLDLNVDLTAFEIDYGFIKMLKDIFSTSQNFKIIEGDVIKTWQKVYNEQGCPDYIFGNLPYNVAGGMIADFVEAEVIPKRMVFTVQKESADRMRARVNTENYSSFSVLCQTAFKITASLDLKPGSFWPMPDVTSTVIVMEKRTDFPKFIDRKLFLKILRGFFATRRKTLRNNIKVLDIPQEEAFSALAKCGITPDQRAETLSPEAITEFANTLALILMNT